MKVYDCDHCGLCCHIMIVEATPLDVLREPLIATEGTIWRGFAKEPHIYDARWNLSAGEGCPFHKENRCSIYPTRPNECVEFQPGSEKCQWLREQFQLSRLEPIERDGVVAEIREACL